MSVLMDKNLKFSIASIAQYDDLFEESFFKTFDKLTKGSEIMTISQLLRLLWCGMLKEDPDVKPTEVADMLEEHLEDGGTLDQVMAKLVGAITKCVLFKVNTDAEVSEEASPKRRKTSTSKSG